MLRRRSLYKKLVGIIQNLSSLKLSGESLPIGMNDEVNGNDVNFVQSPCFEGDQSALINTNVVLSANQISNFDIEFNYSVDNSKSSTFIFSNRSSSKGIGLSLNTLSDSVFTIYGVANYSVSNLRLINDDSFHKYRLRKVADVIESWTDNIYNGSLSGLPTTSVQSIGDLKLIAALDNSNNPVFLYTGFFYGFKMLELDANGDLVGTVCSYPLSEPIKDAANHTYYDVVGGNHATLINGSLANEGNQDEFHYGQFGYTVGDGTNGAPIGHIIPASATDPTKDALGNTLTVPNDNDFKNTGTLLQQPEVAELIAADVDNVYFDVGGNAKKVTVAEIESAIIANPDVYGGDVLNSGESIKNITLK